ncbi:hypothetical protein D3C71_1816560 [compost metagenome]
MTTTTMPNTSGTSRVQERVPSSRSRLQPASGRVWIRLNMKAVAAPDTRNSRDSRQGAVSTMKGSSAWLACRLFTCQSQVT